ncbi:MAG TPA: TetR/AcrR family transcriptional regulator [Stellaceae bacterium]|nr:TetR/AcrR family transcriptional regulator [Stellaceae bacterium]
MTLQMTSSEPREALDRPRDRILRAARDLFYRNGIHAVGVDAIAEAAGTNKMTLYRHFRSKDELVAECLKDRGRELEAAWLAIEAAHGGDPRGQLLAWLDWLAEFKLEFAGTRGCAFLNAAVELPDPTHPARRVIESIKSLHHTKLVALCRAAGLRDPELLADELFLLGEGARVSVQSVGVDGPAARLAEMFQRLVTAHESH